MIKFETIRYLTLIFILFITINLLIIIINIIKHLKKKKLIRPIIIKIIIIVLFFDYGLILSFDYLNVYIFLNFYCELNKFKLTFKISKINFSNNLNLSISHARMLIHFYIIEHCFPLFSLTLFYPFGVPKL